MLEESISLEISISTTTDISVFYTISCVFDTGSKFPCWQELLFLFHLIFSFCSPKLFSVHLPICVQPSLHLLQEEGSLELYHAAQAYLEQQHCWQYALGLYDFLLEGRVFEIFIIFMSKLSPK